MPPFASPSAPVAQSDFDRGMHHFARQKFEEAMQSFEAALAARPDDIETKFQIGRVLLETLRAKDAIAWFKDVADQKPDDAKVCAS